MLYKHGHLGEMQPISLSFFATPSTLHPHPSPRLLTSPHPAALPAYNNLCPRWHPHQSTYNHPISIMIFTALPLLALATSAQGSSLCLSLPQTPLLLAFADTSPPTLHPAFCACMSHLPTTKLTNSGHFPPVPTHRHNLVQERHGRSQLDPIGPGYGYVLLPYDSE